MFLGALLSNLAVEENGAVDAGVGGACCWGLRAIGVRKLQTLSGRKAGRQAEAFIVEGRREFWGGR
jgi:hypothetical protein